MVGPTIATPLVMHAQASDYEASRTKCGSLRALRLGTTGILLTQGVQIHSEKYDP